MKSTMNFWHKNIIQTMRILIVEKNSTLMALLTAIELFQLKHLKVEETIIFYATKFCPIFFF
jgi:hypothetical protein